MCRKRVEVIVEAVVYGVKSAWLDPEHGTGDSVLRRHVSGPWDEGVCYDAGEFGVLVLDYGGEVCGAGGGEGVHEVVEVGLAVVVEREAVGEELEADAADGVGGGGGGGGGGEDALAGDFGGGEGDVEVFLGSEKAFG